MQPTNIEGIAKDVAAAVMGNPIIQITFSPGAEQDGFESDLRIELTRVLASNPSLVRSVPSPLLPLPDQVLEAIVLAIFEAMGGEGDSSEYKHHWLNVFTSDERHGVEDTFNRCNSKGWLHTTTNTDIDASTTTLTPAGREHLAAMRRTPADRQDAVILAHMLSSLWRPIEEADRSVASVLNIGGMELRNSDPVWARDDDGRIYEAIWTHHKAGFWWDLEGESPVYPTEFMPHPLSVRTEPAQ